MEKNSIKIIPLQDGIDLSYIQRPGPVRDHFVPVMYRCLPMTIASQYGWIVKSPFHLQVEWDGSTTVEGVRWAVKRDEDFEARSHTFPIMPCSVFGNGVLTLHPRFILKTPKDINILVKQPPNFIRDGLSWFEGSVESDNLESTFTFNIRVLRPKEKFYIKKGEPLAAFIPYPRFFIESFELEEEREQEEIARLRNSQKTFEEARHRQLENGKSEFYYRNGKTFSGCPFHNEHQKVLFKPKRGGDDLEV